MDNIYNSPTKVKLGKQ